MVPNNSKDGHRRQPGGGQPFPSDHFDELSRPQAVGGPPLEEMSSVLDAAQFESLRQLAAASGEPAFLTGLVDRYLAGAALRFTELQEAARRGDAAGLAEAAHALKGTSASMSAAGLASVCAALEAAAVKGEVSLPEALDRVAAELERAAAALRAGASAHGRGAEDQ